MFQSICSTFYVVVDGYAVYTVHGARIESAWKDNDSKNKNEKKGLCFQTESVAGSINF